MRNIENKLRNERGITLIALVITVIVLLILAGVTIGLLTGENGILNTAKNAADKYNNASFDEQNQINNLLNLIGGGSGNSIEEPENEIQPGEVATENKEYEDKNGDRATIPKDFEISTKPEEQTIDEGLVIKDFVGNEWVWIPVNDTTYPIYEYNSSESRNVGVLYDFTLNVPTKRAYSAIEWREPDIVVDYDGGIHDIAGITKEKIQNEFNDMIESVNKYKGYYIGRYETGNLSEAKVVVQKGNTDINKQTWYTMYKKAGEMYDSNASVKASMIWGSQWDQAMIWMKDVKNVENISQYYVTNSKEMGVYKPTSLQPSGKYGIKNVYDMAGNVFDMTMETNSTSNRGRRGGSWNNSGETSPASHRYGVSPNYYDSYFRS